MMSTRKTYRLGTTAIAAVLALSATRLAAQEAPATDAPVVEMPTVVTTPTEPTTSVDPLAPVAEPEATTPIDTATEATEAADTAPVAKSTTKKPSPKPKSTAQRIATKSSASTEPAPAAAAVEANAEPAVAPTSAVAPSPNAEAPPVVEAKPADKKLDEAVPLAGGAGAVILALAGAGMAVRRRKRREEEEELEQGWSDEPVIEAEAAPELEPVWDPPVVAPKPVAAVTSDLPEDFDTSKFGRHVQAAYEGPTAENPSLSLRKRLKVAGELDRRERLNGIPPESTKPASVRTETPQSMSFMFSGTPSKQKWPEPQL